MLMSKTLGMEKDFAGIAMVYKHYIYNKKTMLHV
jgi:hypothetical protein